MHPIFFYIPDWVPLLGGEPVTSFGIFMFLAFLTAGIVLKAEMERKDLDGEKAWDILFMAVVGGLVGAKLYYVLLNYPRLLDEGLSFVFNRGGMVWYGGLIVATGLCLWEIHRSKLPMGKVVDASAPAMALAYSVGRIGCFMVGDDWGRPTMLPWGVRFPEGAPPTTVTRIKSDYGIDVDPEIVARFGEVVPVHPTQLYEVALSFIIFLVLWRLRAHKYVAGWLLMLWFALSGVERFLVEFVRLKDDRFFGLFTLAQFISIGFVILGIVGMRRLSAGSRRDGGAAGVQG